MKITKRQLKRIITKKFLQLEQFDTGSAGDEVGGTTLEQKKEQCEKAGGEWVSDDPSGKYGHCSVQIKEQRNPRFDDDYDPLDPDDDEDDAAYDQGYDDGFNGYPSKPVIGGDYHVGYEEGVHAAKDEASREDDPEAFGPHSPEMMGPPRREGKVRLTKRQLQKIIKEEKKRLLSEAVVPKEQLEDAILNIFYVEGAVASADVYDRLRMDGYTDEEISGGISNRGGAPWAE